MSDTPFVLIHPASTGRLQEMSQITQLPNASSHQIDVDHIYRSRILPEPVSRGTRHGHKAKTLGPKSEPSVKSVKKCA